MPRIAWILSVFAIAACNASAACEPRSLNILLTNDDGFDQPGIVALHRALDADGHFVRRIAPNRNFSGSAASLTFDRIDAPSQPDEEFDEIYAVAATPATAVLLGLTAIFGPDEPVDLVVSGINNGLNIGPITPLSGTVGAIVSGMKLFDPPVPGIAISTNRLSDEVSKEQNEEHLARVAIFVAGIVRNGQCGDRPLFASGQSLNINYPRREATEIKGPRIARQGRHNSLRLWFSPGSGDVYEPQVEWLGPQDGSGDTDFELLRDGYISIVPIDANFSTTPEFDVASLLTADP